MRATHHLKFGLATAACGFGLLAIFFGGYLLRQFCAHVFPSEPLPTGTTLALAIGLYGPLLGIAAGVACWILSCRRNANPMLNGVPFVIAISLVLWLAAMLICFVLPLTPSWVLRVE